MDGGALCLGLFFCLGEWGGKYKGSIYDWWAFVRVLKIAFGNMVWGLFRWLFAANSVWIWNLSMVFK